MQWEIDTRPTDNMKNRRNYYRILQVQPDAPLQVIRAAYKTLMRELRQHPDLGGDLWNAKVLNQAYETLSHQDKRQAYDRSLFERYTKKPLRNSLTGQPPLITLFCPFCKRPMARKAQSMECCPTCRSPLQSQAGEQLSQDCRRSKARIRKSEPFYYYTTWPQQRREALLVDVSEDGLRFTTSESLADDMLVKISGRLFKGVARINNVHKVFSGGRKRYSVGGEFVSVVFRETRGNFCSASA